MAPDDLLYFGLLYGHAQLGFSEKTRAPVSVTRKLHISGKFPNPDIVSWIIDRADNLSLAGWVRMHSDQYIELLACGDEILVEALEVSCSLGPIDAQIDSIEIQNSIPATEYPRQKINSLNTHP